MKNIYFYNTDIGMVGIAENGTAITDLFFSSKNEITDGIICETMLLKEAKNQLTEYFEGKSKHFDIPLAPYGTEFQKTVWEALQTIPYGETRSYKQIAEKTGNPKAARAVGMANNRNPIAIFIPCHRVIGADGSLVGYASGLSIKKYLLELEQKYAYK